jgi:tRNA threonylcarbamoyladenosine biosynthesis protein TsaB
VRLIAFDTATEWCTAALWQDGAVTHRAVHAGQKHSDLLTPMVMELLAEAGLSLRQLDGLAYGMGPGSFTGLRIACGVVQGLALAADLPVLGVSTLEALAEEAREQAGATQVAACLDARMGEVYAALYDYQADAWQALVGPVVCPPQAAPGREGFLPVGSGVAAYPELGPGRGDLIPHARAIARLAAPRLAAGQGGPAETAQPLYVRDKVALKVCER